MLLEGAGNRSSPSRLPGGYRPPGSHAGVSRDARAAASSTQPRSRQQHRGEQDEAEAAQRSIERARRSRDDPRRDDRAAVGARSRQAEPDELKRNKVETAPRRSEQDEAEAAQRPIERARRSRSDPLRDIHTTTPSPAAVGARNRQAPATALARVFDDDAARGQPAAAATQASFRGLSALPESSLNAGTTASRTRPVTSERGALAISSGSLFYSHVVKQQVLLTSKGPPTPPPTPLSSLTSRSRSQVLLLQGEKQVLPTSKVLPTPPPTPLSGLTSRSQVPHTLSFGGAFRPALPRARFQDIHRRTPENTCPAGPTITPPEQGNHAQVRSRSLTDSVGTVCHTICTIDPGCLSEVIDADEPADYDETGGLIQHLESQAAAQDID